MLSKHSKLKQTTLAMRKVVNFSSGPAMVPESVLLTAQQQMLDWNNSGMSVMEISHRSQAFQDLLTDTQQRLRQLMKIPKNYHILFMASGARAQFAAVPLNLLKPEDSACYAVTGLWSWLAMQQAKKYANVTTAFEIDEPNLTDIPAFSDWNLDSNARYLYCTPNETLTGLALPVMPDVDLPIIADMTSCILSKRYDVDNFGLIFASAQKNLGQAGVTVVIIRDDLLKTAQEITPDVLNYQLFNNANSVYNTPPCYAIYIMNLVLAYYQDQGGLAVIEQQNQQKAAMMYSYIDQSEWYQNKVAKDFRSLVNVTFQCPTKTLDLKFVEQAAQHGLMNLKGHAKFGGLRASLYNAMPLSGVEKLLEFMDEFKRDHK